MSVLEIETKDEVSIVTLNRHAWEGPVLLWKNERLFLKGGDGIL